MENYTQVRVLGKGSFGAAWLVKRKKDGQQFVAKEVNLSMMKREEREAAKHEISMLRALDNPNITRYVDHFEHKGNLFIVMEYANGGDLYTKIQSRRGVRFTEKEVLHYFVQLTLAIYHMHEKRILHRDLKTQNVFLTADGVIKLGDFGISTVLRNTYELKRTVCGTPYYFSPELCMNKPYNNKSDIWALGCILYELTTLNHAFDAQSMKGLVQRILRGVYPPIHSSYSRDLSTLIAGMLSLDPQKRPHIAQIVQLPFIRTAMSSLQKEVHAANDEKRSCVDQDLRAKEKEEAARRAAEEKAAREKKEAAAKEQAVERERQYQERVDRMRQQMALEAKEHEEKLNRIKQAQREADEKRKAEMADRMKRLDEERKLRAQRDGEIQAANRRREEEWERNMKAAQLEADRVKEAAAAAGGGVGGIVPPGVQQQQQLQRDAYEAARLYRENRAAAEANRARALEEERAQREAGRRAFEQQAQQQDARDALPQKPRPAAYDAGEAARAFHDMRQAAQQNRMRALQDPPPVAHQPPPQHRSEPEPAPVAGKKDAKALSPAEMEEARRAAFWEMRRAADENKRRLLGLDPAPPAAPASAPAAQQQQQAVKPSAPRSTPPQQPSAAPAAPPPPPMPKSPTPPSAPVSAPPPSAQMVPLEAESDDDGDLGYHKFLNADAAAAVEEGDSDGSKLDASRQADYRGVDDNISALLHNLDHARIEEPIDFGDPDPDPSHFILDGQTLVLPNVTSQDPLGHRIESLRLFLEESLGDERFIRVYRMLSTTDDEDEAQRKAHELLGAGLVKYLPVVVQLIVCEEAFNAQENLGNR